MRENHDEAYRFGLHQLRNSRSGPTCEDLSLH
jgi:hypothetical protein